MTNTIFPTSLQQLGFELHHSSGQIPYLLPPLCTIPEGTFLMGSDPTKDEQAEPEESPQHSVWLPTYRIGKYPVTVAEYACAMQAHAPEVQMPTGKKEWWEKQLTHPTWSVYGLTWYDALAYTRWLQDMTGKAWRLPTEAEWEKAARGTDGRIYPWGNQWDSHNANTLAIEQSTTPIDAYTHAASPYGVIDMVGNIAEWTNTIYDPPRLQYPYVPTDGREATESDSPFRRLRGGSRLLQPRMARAASRSFFHVEDRYDWVHGMRLAYTKATS